MSYLLAKSVRKREAELRLDSLRFDINDQRSRLLSESEHRELVSVFETEYGKVSESMLEYYDKKYEFLRRLFAEEKAELRKQVESDPVNEELCEKCNKKEVEIFDEWETPKPKYFIEKYTSRGLKWVYDPLGYQGKMIIRIKPDHAGKLVIFGDFYNISLANFAVNVINPGFNNDKWVIRLNKKQVDLFLDWVGDPGVMY